jgi:predicted esterase YcpF (UPF0227 family)
MELKKEIITLFEDDFCRISMIDGDGDIVTLSISSSPRIGEDFSSEEFIKTSTKDGKGVFLIDKTNSFGNRLDWDVVIDTLSPHLVDKDVRAVGFCLGGFLATVLSKHFRIHSVVAITPQYSVMPEYMPEDSFMLGMYTNSITEWKIPSLEGYFQEDTNYYVFASCEADDKIQIAHFPIQDNVFIFDFGDDYDHGLPGQLGIDLETLVEACFEHEPWVVTDFIEDHYA